MRILYIITSTETGGAEKALLDLVKASAALHTVKVLSLKKLGSVAQEMQKAGIEVVSLQMKWYNQTRIIKKIGQEIGSFKPDLVHAMLYRGIEFARMACAGKGGKLLTTPHFDLSKKNIFLRGIDFLLKDLDTLTVAESFATARYLVEKQKYKKEKVYLLPNGADPAVFYKDHSLRSTMRKQYGFLDTDVVFVSVARLAEEKDPITLLQAFRNVLRTCSNAKLVYVGEGSERTKLTNFIQQNKLDKSVFLVGEQEHINGYLNLADVFVLTSVEESLPLSLLEALRVNLPCIVTKVGDMPLWVEHGKNGFVCKPKDVILLSCMLTELGVNSQLRNKMGVESANISKRIKPTSPQYQQIYQQVKMNSFHVKTQNKTK